MYDHRRAGREPQHAIGHDNLSRSQSLFNNRIKLPLLTDLYLPHLDGLIRTDDKNEGIVLAALDRYRRNLHRIGDPLQTRITTRTNCPGQSRWLAFSKRAESPIMPVERST